MIVGHTLLLMLLIIMKSNRNYKSIINVWGADHGGYVKRVGGVINAFSDRKIDFDVKLCQLVSLSNKGKPLKCLKEQVILLL